jgi:hypothetical protein
MITHRYCCGEQNAIYQFSIKPITENKTHWKRAVYQCKLCKEITIRADTNLKAWNTKITIIDEHLYEQLRKERQEYERRIVDLTLQEQH